MGIGGSSSSHAIDLGAVGQGVDGNGRTGKANEACPPFGPPFGPPPSARKNNGRFYKVRISRRMETLIPLGFLNAGMVGAVGFEPTAFCSRSKRATRLRYAPTGETSQKG